MLPTVDSIMYDRIKNVAGILEKEAVHRKEMHMKETFGERIRRLRKDRKLKQEQVAAALSVNRKAVSHYENDVRELSFETLIRLSEILLASQSYYKSAVHLLREPALFPYLYIR